MGRIDHIDLRAPRLAEVRPFYERLLPALGFTRYVPIDGWFTYEREETDGAPAFFGITESPQHVPNECRVAFWADSNQEVERLAELVRTAGGRNVEGPLFEESGYYAVFFEDPAGNRLEICHRIVPPR